ncbi:MAG: universal stress protein, partial [Bacteroidota bacterium]
AQGSRLVAVHVIEPIDIPPPYGLAVAGFNPAELKDRVRQTVERWVSSHAEGPVPIEVDIREGSALVQIVDAAEAHGASLIVQSSHGRRGLSRWLLGSVAEAVARRAPCPTLTLRVGARGLTRSETETLPVPKSDWAELFDVLSERIASTPHAVSVEVLSPEAEGLVYDSVRMLGVTYDPNDDAIGVMTESGEHNIAHPFAIRSTIGGWALDAARDASARGPWALEVVRDDGMRERVTFWETATQDDPS